MNIYQYYNIHPHVIEVCNVSNNTCVLAQRNTPSFCAALHKTRQFLVAFVRRRVIVRALEDVISLLLFIGLQNLTYSVLDTHTHTRIIKIYTYRLL